MLDIGGGSGGEVDGGGVGSAGCSDVGGGGADSGGAGGGVGDDGDEEDGVWLFYPLADCPPHGSSSMDGPLFGLSTVRIAHRNRLTPCFRMNQPLICLLNKRWSNS